MQIIENCSGRELKSVAKAYDLIVAGGGITGVCCAIVAAREGLSVALINDRPVLGGNASSEVRLWILGATSHMGNNNRWSREGGVIDELLVENTYRNKEGNALFFDMVMMDKVLAEKNIDLYLNTVIVDIEKSSDRVIEKVYAFNPQNATKYCFTGKQIADCSGDGIVSYLAGASYRIGAEDKEEYGEQFVMDKEGYGELLGHSIFFYMKDTGKPVQYVAPEFALKDAESKIAKLQRPEYTNTAHHGCKYWWFEYGGRLDTVHDTEQIKFELWKVVYGVWDYLKNSGIYPEMENYTLEWAGLIPGKRESRRFKGYSTMIQQDIIEQRTHFDDVACGGWSIDLHPSDGVYSDMNGCNQWHSKGVYPISLGSLISCDIDNLFICGRMASSSHAAFGSTRVMATSAHGAQAAAITAALAVENGDTPKAYLTPERIKLVQQRLINIGQYIPQLELNNFGGKLKDATLTPSSTLALAELPAAESRFPLDFPVATLCPFSQGAVPQMAIEVEATQDTELEVQLRTSIKPFNFTPDVTLGTRKIALKRGVQTIRLDWEQIVDEGYYFICFMKNPHIALAESDAMVTGVMSVYNYQNIAVSNYGKQVPPADLGVESFEFWTPLRRPHGKNLAIAFTPSLQGFGVEHLRSEYLRPVVRANAWVADIADKNPTLTITWNEPVTINKMRLFFDTNADLAMENVQMGHFDSIVPQCVRAYSVKDDKGNVVHTCSDNHQTRNDILFEGGLQTTSLELSLDHPSVSIPAALFGLLIE